MEVKIKKLVPEAEIPNYATSGSAGMDIKAVALNYDRETDTWIYSTGLSFEVPKGYVMLLFPRSSIFKTNFYLANHVGVLDSDYRGELKFMFKERGTREIPASKGPYKVGERIGQLIIVLYPKIEFLEVEELEETERGEGGFGSTGK